MSKDRKTQKLREKVIRQVPAVSRSIAILRHLARQDKPVGVVHLAEELGIIPSTCLHILRVLVDEGLASFEPATKKYKLGPGILALANDFVTRNSLVQLVQPHLDKISRDRQCTAVAVEPTDAEHLIVVAAADLNPGISVRVAVGTRFPSLVSATGRCVAAYGNFTREELQARFATLRWSAAPTFAAWYREVHQVRENGYAIDRGHYIRGLTTMATPILNNDYEILGAIAVVGVSDRFTPASVEQLAQDLRSAAAHTACGLGGSEQP